MKKESKKKKSEKKKKKKKRSNTYFRGASGNVLRAAIATQISLVSLCLKEMLR